jgi:hypothetical protein
MISMTSSPGASIIWIFCDDFSAFHFGIPCVRWLRALVNRIDPDLFRKLDCGAFDPTGTI